MFNMWGINNKCVVNHIIKSALSDLQRVCHLLIYIKEQKDGKNKQWNLKQCTSSNILKSDSCVYTKYMVCFTISILVIPVFASCINN